MKKEQLIREYNSKKEEIKDKLNEFKKLSEPEHIYELFFCLLTPQSNAKKCWQAVEQLKNLKNFNKATLTDILKSKTRFHNNKTKYLLEAKKEWPNISLQLKKENPIEIRNWLHKNVKGLGLKESSHFLRNIGKSDNKIAILDRHILKNLSELKVINQEQIKNPDHYLEIESKFQNFSREISIPIDELDLLFWSSETNEIFK